MGRPPELTKHDTLKAMRLCRELYDHGNLRALSEEQMHCLLVRLVEQGCRPWPQAWLRSLPYKDGYLQSAWWRIRKAIALRRAGHKCEGCGGRPTAVHHRTYENLGDEKDEDLMAVCRICHNKEHMAGDIDDSVIRPWKAEREEKGESVWKR